MDVNDIFGDDSISVVSQYDGRRVSPWTVWTRGEDGMFMSAPAGRTNIDPGLGLYVNSSDGTDLKVDIPGVSRDAPAAGAAVHRPDTRLEPGGGHPHRPRGKDGWSERVPARRKRGAERSTSNNTTGQLRSFSPPKLRRRERFTNEGTDLIKAGQALWVYATKAGTIVPK